MKCIVHIAGNRPQFIKLAVLYKELAGSGQFTQKIVHTGQHFSYEMSDLFFDELNIPAADINFNINNLPVHEFIAKATGELEKYFKALDSSSIAFVYGDTNTTVAAAIAAKKAKLFLVHFEAGVRTGDTSMPEEINRISTDRLADINLCCTALNCSNLQAEGFGSRFASKLYLTGDLMLDAFNKLSKKTTPVTTELNYTACTIHRAANINDGPRLHQVIEALNKINSTSSVIFPVHPNTRKMMERFGCKPAFKMLAPLGYYDMKALLAGASRVITDSGGTCREAYFLKKPALIIMDRPFWPEIIEQHCAMASAAVADEIVEKFFALPGLHGNFETGIFGDGHAAVKIRKLLEAL